MSKMNFEVSKNKAIVIAMLLMLSLATFAALVPSTKADTIQPYCFLSVQPNPIGVGQYALVAMWIDMTPPLMTNGTETPWVGLTATVTCPNGTVLNYGPRNTDAAGTWAFSFLPDVVGNYTFQFSFPGQNVSNSNIWRPQYIGNTYLPATSPKVVLTVQQEAVASAPIIPLPPAYWQRPIDAQNSGWASISGPWLGISLLYGAGASSDGTFNPYSNAPQSAHILWTRTQTIGGVVGGNLGVGLPQAKSFVPTSSSAGLTYYSGLSYNSRYGPPIIMNGYLYFNNPIATSGSAGGASCVNLKTGQTVWWQNITLSCGQILDYESPNQHGAIPYLWQTGNPYRMFDAYTGDLVLTLANASSGRITMDAQGDMCVYVLDGVHHWLAMWNSSYAPYMQGLTGGTAYTWAPPLGTTQDWRAGIQWNETNLPSAPIYGGTLGICTVGQNTIIASCMAGPDTVCAIGYSMIDGHQLWQTNITSNVANENQYFILPIANGVFTFFRQETMQFSGYSIATGQLVWGPTAPYTNAWGMFTSSTVGLGASNPTAAYGNLYATAYDGEVHAYDMSTGTNLWNFYDGNTGFEEAYGHNPLGSGTNAIAGNTIFAATGEHGPGSPFPQGAEMYAVNTTDGSLTWSILGWYQMPAVADGVLTAFNSYDGQIYAFGQGLSATTVNAPTLATSIGNPVLIQGSVTDQSPGQTCLGVPAAGTPAISDASQSQWMEYLYMQQPMPTNATGVPVTLSYIDPNGNSYSMGTTTSDMTGHYAYNFNPTIPGLYTITASFDGTNSYYASSAETSFVVAQAAATPTPAAQSMADIYFVPVSIAIILIIIIIGIVLVALMLRKRP